MTVLGRLPANRLAWIARDEESSRDVTAFFESWDRPFGIVGEFLPLGARDTYFKAEPMFGRARVRHALRRGVLRRPYPRLAEFENLRWLEAHDFATAKPLAAGVREVWNGIDWQFLFTERFTAAEPLVPADSAQDSSRILALAHDVARMHDLGFVHRDLHLRNLAWRRTETPHVLFYDAWRGGARIQSRGIPYDIECLCKGLRAEWGDAAVREFLDVYAQSRTSKRGLRKLERLRGEVPLRG